MRLVRRTASRLPRRLRGWRLLLTPLATLTTPYLRPQQGEDSCDGITTSPTGALRNAVRRHRPYRSAESDRCDANGQGPGPGKIRKRSGKRTRGFTGIHRDSMHAPGERPGNAPPSAPELPRDLSGSDRCRGTQCGAGPTGCPNSALGCGPLRRELRGRSGTLRLLGARDIQCRALGEQIGPRLQDRRRMRALVTEVQL